MSPPARAGHGGELKKQAQPLLLPSESPKSGGPDRPDRPDRPAAADEVGPEEACLPADAAGTGATPGRPGGGRPSPEVSAAEEAEGRGWLASLRSALAALLELILELMSERAVQITAAATAGGALLGGCLGAGLGCLAGGLLGAFLGVVPALFTFGLSVPVGAVLFGSVGLCIGACLGALLGGLAVGLLGYAVHTGLTLSKLLRLLRASALEALATARGCLGRSWTSAREAVRCLRARGPQLATDPAVRFSLAAAVAGAGALGTAGGGTGAVVGGALGGTIGVLPAVFTFGLSIPVLAVVGSGVGLVVGSTAGGATGFFGGGALGYVAHGRKGDVCGVAKQAWAAAQEKARTMAPLSLAD